MFPVAMRTTGGDETASGFSIWSPSNPFGSFFTFAFCGDLMTGTRLGLPDLHDGVIMFTNGAALNPAAYICLGTGGAAPLYFSTNNALRITVDGNGLVGIGSAAPSGAFLHVTAAGTTSNAPVKLTSGTDTTTAGAGEIGYNGTRFTATAAASSRQVLDAEQFITLTSAYTLTSQTAAQKMFNSPTNGAVTVQGSTAYFFECFFSLTAMSATSGSFGFALGGTATLTSQKWRSEAAKAALATASTAQITDNTAANTTIVTANTTTTGHAYIKGKIRVNAGGTIIPQVSLGVAAAAIVGTDSTFRIWAVGSSTVQSEGNWS